MNDDQLELLFEADGLGASELPDALASLYGGGLGLDESCLIANFVATIDGVVAIPSLPASNRLIAAASESDRFVMGLLRACCDAVMIGAGTLSASPRSLWTPERAFAGAADGYAELRRSLGRPATPELVVLSASGLFDCAHPAIQAGALVLTSKLGAQRLAGELPPSSSAVSLGPARRLDPGGIVAELRARGHRRILSEGGPHAIGPLFLAGLVDELFLTVSPLLLGRDGADPRLALVEGADLLPAGPTTARLLSLRRAGHHLLLRYGLRERWPAPVRAAASRRRGGDEACGFTAA